MRKLLTFLLTMMVTLLANAYSNPTIKVGDDLGSVADAAQKGVAFAIVNPETNKALYGSGAQNLGYDATEVAYASTAGYVWRLISLADNPDENLQGYYHIHLVAPDGNDYSFSAWGGTHPGYLNSQPLSGNASFILGLGENLGQDFKYGAVYDIQYVDGQGFTIKNVGTDKYQSDNGAAASDEPVYWSFKKADFDYSAAVAEVLEEGEAYKANVTNPLALMAFASTAASLTTESVKSIDDVAKAKAAVLSLIKAQSAANTDMTVAVPNAAGNAAVGADNWQLANDLAAGEKFQLDTWAGTASGMSTPHIEFWHAPGTVLVANTISQTITGLTPGTYKVTATTAVNNEQTVALTAGSALLFANEGETDITEVVAGVSTATSFSGTTGTFSVEGTVGTDGVLTIGFKAVDPNYNWLAFKDVTLTLVEAAVIEEDDWYKNGTFVAKDYSYTAIKPADYKDGEAKPAVPFKYDAKEKNGYMEVVSNANRTNPWDSQILMSIPEDLVGKKVEVSFRAQASKAVTAEGQLHVNNNGSGWTPHAAPSVNFVVGDWQEYTLTIETGEFSQWGNNYAAQNTFVLNLTNDATEPITYKFDDVQISEAKEDWAYLTTVIAKDYNPDFGRGELTAADYPNGAKFPAVPYKVDAESKGYMEVVSNNSPSTAWDCQLFIKIPGETKKGQTVKISMEVKADRAYTSSADVHFTNDGTGWFGHGGLTNISFTDEWAPYEGTVELSEINFGGANRIGTDLVYNLSDDKAADPTAAANHYYFRNLNIVVEDAPVLTWVELIPNGDCETAAEHVFAAAKESPINPEEIHQARILDGVGVDDSKGIEVVAGDKTSQPWDNQFWIYEPYSLPTGTKYIVEFDYKAKEAAKASTQVHLAPGAYQWYSAIGDVNFTTEWKHFSYEGKVSAGQDGATINIRSIAFNLSELATANTYYIDNISFRVPEGTIDGIEPVYIDEYPTAEYIDPTTLTYTGNILTNGDLEGEKMDEFVGKIVKGDYILDDNDEPIEFVYEDLDPEILLLAATDYEDYWEQPLANDEVGGSNGLSLEVAEWKDGKGNDHDSQIWLRLPYALPEGTLFQLEFDYAGSNTADAIELQAHREPSQYISGLGKAIKPVTNADEEWVWSHYSEYLKAPKDMRSIAFNLGSESGGIYLFDNFSVKLVEDDMDFIQDFTTEWDEAWDEALALNEAIYEGKNTETEGMGYTEASVNYLEETIAAGKVQLNGDKTAEPAVKGYGDQSEDVTKETLAQATQDILDAIAGLTTEEFVPLPDLTEYYVPIEMSQADYGSFAKTTMVGGKKYLGNEYTTYTASGQIQGAFKMTNVDVTGCDKIFVYFAQPVKKGWSKAFWGKQEDVQDVAEGATYIEFDLTEKYNGNDDATYQQEDKTILKEVTLIALWGTEDFPLDAKVYGVYKHLADDPIPTDIADVSDDVATSKVRKYIENGQIVIVKDGKKYNTAGVEIE